MCGGACLGRWGDLGGFSGVYLLSANLVGFRFPKPCLAANHSEIGQYLTMNATNQTPKTANRGEKHGGGRRSAAGGAARVTTEPKRSPVARALLSSPYKVGPR